MKRKTTEKSEPNKKKFVVHKYTVVKFDDEDHGKLFECIPDIWFVNELRESCRFPPKTGKCYIQRAVNCEKPDDSWGIYECSVVKGGFLTYNAGFKLVQEKCSQPYNTSSAEEERQAADFRRQHPGLVGGNIEHVFSKPQSQTTEHESMTPNHDKTKKSERNVNGMLTSDNDVMTSVDSNDTTEESVKTQKRNNKQTSCVKSTPVIERTTSTTCKNANANLPASSSICSKGPSHCGSVQSLNSRFDSSRSRSRSQRSTARAFSKPRSTISRPSISPKPKHSRLNGKSLHVDRFRGSRSHSSLRSSRSRSSPRSEISRQSIRSKGNHSRSNGKLSHKNGIRDSRSHSSVRYSRSRSISQRSSPCSEIPSKSTSSTPSLSRSNETFSHKNGTLDSRSHSSVRPSRSRSYPRSEISRQSIIPKPNHSRSNGISSHTDRVRENQSHSSVRLSRSRSISQQSNQRSEISRQSIIPKPNHSRSNGISSHTDRVRENQSHSSVRLSRSRSISQQSNQRSEISRQSIIPKPNHSRSKGKPSHTNGIRCEQLRKSHHRSRRSSFRSSSEHSSIRSCHSRSKRKRTVNSRSHPPSSKASKTIRTANALSTQERSNKPVRNCKQSSTGKHSSSTDSRNFPTHGDPSRPANNSECTSVTMNHVISSINELTEAVKKSNNQMTQNDRRMNRLEVTVNKILITLGDMNGHNLTNDDNDLDVDFEGPDLPIISKTELYMVNRKLKDKEFRRLWINKEKHFCCPTKTSTDTRTISKYLKRFISLRVRSQLTLKEQGGETEYTLYRDYGRVYDFLIDVMKNGYAIGKKKISRDEAHTALRVVWGRSKQLYNGEKKKNSRL